MKYVLKDLAPRPEKDLFITQYWSDKQSDPPLHFHEDYMLSLTLNVRGTRITGRTADDFTEKDLIIIFRAFRTATRATKPMPTSTAKPWLCSSAATCPTGSFSKPSTCNPFRRC